MQRRSLTPDLNVSALGLGCMGMSEFYGPRDDAQSMQVLHRAADLGVTFFDTADMYGPHHNEELLGRFLRERKPQVEIATKFGIVRKPGEYARTIDNSAEYARAACEASLRRLEVERIDLYYVHRIDRSRPIEDVMEELSSLVRAGKIGHIGLSEVSAATLRRAHAVHPIAAVQTEYSLWSRDVESDVLPTCRELGIGFVPYSPLGRGFLTGTFDGQSDFADGDFRANLPRFSAENIDANRRIVDVVRSLALTKDCTSAQIALAWLLSKGDHIVPIPGTKRLKYLEENVAAVDVVLSPDEITALEAGVSELNVAGGRYTDEGMKGLDA
ncbi:aryl-alcohol dehydrogenase-like predicted oxidoreductase [Marinobacter sp. LV10R520-4]|uniref:aldo/keto reductase n=1 Tax=Marinobacter sp. LV10R520-4 TaxID=1761796 RepID=UPI000BF49CFA|nr:aldo/keto reductase [Marinobacter sp. LV10R520-4]PFG52560.1 aryl-alcohol dehydrogenase-like predicted oxidoreductase [Marinobacter sp. LV10R520-4]